MNYHSPLPKNDISAADLPAHYRSVRERLMNCAQRPKPEPEPKERAGNRLGVFSVKESNRLGVISIEEIIPTGRLLSKKQAVAELRKICARRGLPLEDALGSKRYSEIVRARHECWANLSKLGHSLAEIGRVFGYDHTTVRHGIQKHRGQ